MGSSRTRARTHVPCIGRRILNHCTTREAPCSCLIDLIFGIIWIFVYLFAFLLYLFSLYFVSDCYWYIRLQIKTICLSHFKMYTLFFLILLQCLAPPVQCWYYQSLPFPDLNGIAFNVWPLSKMFAIESGRSVFSRYIPSVLNVFIDFYLILFLSSFSMITFI